MLQGALRCIATPRLREFVARIPITPVDVFLCPQGHGKPAKQYFCHTRQQQQIWCSGCARAYAAHSWRCQCQIPWVQCPRHFCACEASLAPTTTTTTTTTTTMTTTTTTTTTGRKRRASSQAMDAETAGFKLRKMEGPPRQFKLGPILAARFPQVARVPGEN
eukprot:2765515-Karenia_brevis.AAC.1